MLSSIRNATVLGIKRQTLRKAFHVNSRANHALVVRIGDEVTYTIEGGESRSSIKGDVIYIPKGCTYTTTPDVDKNEYIIIYFEAEIENPHFQIYHLEELNLAIDVCYAMMSSSTGGTQTDRLLITSHFYKLLSIVSASSEATALQSEKLKLIKPAIEYLGKNVFSPDFKISDLYQISGMSATYFRKLFFAYSGLSPVKYVMQKRLDMAKIIINEGDFFYIKDVALAVGYTDALYFSRIYKKYHGHAPRISKIASQNK